MSINIFNTLPQHIPAQDIPEEHIALAANVLNSYIMEDGLSMKENEIILQRLFDAAEIFMSNFQKVVYLNSSDHAQFKHWLNTLLPSITLHTQQYQSLYQALSHLAEPPYFASDWSISFAVQSAASQHSLLESTDFATLSDKDRNDILYTTRFIDNLFQEFFGAMVANTAPRTT